MTRGDLPRGMQFKNGGYYYIARIGKRQKWIPLGRARDVALQMFADTRRYYSPGAISERMTWARAMLQRARGRSRSDGIACTLDLNKVVELGESQQWRCALTGLAFSTSRLNGSRLAPLAPSMDRIDSTKGYEEGNCRIVVLAINIALNEWGDEIFGTLIAAFEAKNGPFRLPRKLDCLTNGLIHRKNNRG